jgi:hypothetical protein
VLAGAAGALTLYGVQAGPGQGNGFAVGDDPIDRLYQVEPTPGAEPTERTEIRLLFDEHQLYVAFRVHDSEPSRISATTRERDAPMMNEDMVRIILDPHRSGREGYSFELNSAGARMNDMTYDGTLERLSDLSQGRGIDVQLYGSARMARD